jgi:hypothetical protein
MHATWFLWQNPRTFHSVGYVTGNRPCIRQRGPTNDAKLRFDGVVPKAYRISRTPIGSRDVLTFQRMGRRFTISRPVKIGSDWPHIR